ncbi:MAG: Lrp/AsnC family transcriptional regulator [Candidatus Micrarchaeota archaeon]|nr:Lrp/AsnC family transcriptional regulator [Candidatus Micrarchaeota archaeon]
MRASRESKEYVEKELPYKLLLEMYKDSRRSLKELGRGLHISYHTVSKTLSQLEEKYKLNYTLDIDTGKLGFSEGRIITIKFNERPSVELLKQRFQKDVFVQDAYLAEGDFDLLLYVIGLSSKEFVSWQWKLRIELRKYEPSFKTSTADQNIIGFLPIKNALIEASENLSDTEKKVLCALNDNSRIKLKELVQKSKTTQMRVIYVLKKFKTEGVIKKFAALTQNPSKRIFLAYTAYLNPGGNHDKLMFSFGEELLKENKQEVTSDYVLVIDAVGAHDLLYVCTFENGEKLSERGPDLLKTILTDESPKIEKAILTDVITGKWPFHLDDYNFYQRMSKKENIAAD